MGTITREVLRDLLDQCIDMTLKTVQGEVAEPLPEQICLELATFGRSGRTSSLEEVLSLLYINGTFPRVVDIAIKGIARECTIIWIRPSGHAYVSDITDTWNQPPGMGPFKSIGLLLPKWVWERPRPLSLKDLEDAGRERAD
jgi:hypothetical protein